MEEIDGKWRITLFVNGVEVEHYIYTSEAVARRHLKNALAAAKKFEGEGVVSRITTHRTRVQEA